MNYQSTLLAPPTTPKEPVKLNPRTLGKRFSRPFGGASYDWTGYLTGNELKILINLTGRADNTRFSWIGVPALSRITQINTRGVYSALAGLRKKGVIQLSRREEDHRRGHLVNFDWDPTSDKNVQSNALTDSTENITTLDEKHQSNENAGKPLRYKALHDIPSASYPSTENKKKISYSADKPRNIEGVDQPSSRTGEEENFVKLRPSRRNKTKQDESRQRKTKPDWRIEHLAKHLAMHTRKDYRIYFGAGQNATWMRLLEIWPYERVKDAIDEAMTPQYRPTLEKNGYQITAHSIEFYMKSLQKPPVEMTDEDRAAQEIIARLDA